MLHWIVIKWKNLHSNPMEITHIKSWRQMSRCSHLERIPLISGTKLIWHIIRIGISENHSLGWNQFKIIHQLIISINN